MSYEIRHEGPRVFRVFLIHGPDEEEFLEEFKTGHSAKKFVGAKEEEAGYQSMVENVPERIRFLGIRPAKAWQKAMKSNSRKFAIRAFCLECVGGDNTEVAACSAKDCTLWRFRLKG